MANQPKFKQPKPIKMAKVPNPGLDALHQMFKMQTQVTPMSPERSLSKFTGLKRYLKRAI